MSKTDKRNKLKDNPFDYKIMKSQKTLIYYKNRQIMMLSEKDTKKLLQRINNKSEFEIQLALAKVTGNFKHGNE